MKTPKKLLIILVLGCSIISCTPQEISEVEQNGNTEEIFSTGDDDDIEPNNTRD